MATRRIGLRMISSKKWRGGINYIINLTKALHSLPVGERPEVVLLTYDDAGVELAAGLASYVNDIRPLSQASSLKLDIVYPVTQLFEAPVDAPWAAWIPDWQCQYLPDMFDDLELRRRELHFRYLATRAPLLIHSSRMAANDSASQFGDDLVSNELLTFPSVVESVEVARGRARLPVLRRDIDLPSKYFLVANQWWRHKNHRILLEALKCAERDDVVIVCTGDTVDHRSPGYAEGLVAEIEAAGLKKQIRVLGSMNREDQVALMLGAVAIIQPSKFEGWSTVVEEARSLGKNILLSEFPVHRDQNPPLAKFFAPDDAPALAKLMAETLDTEKVQDIIPDTEEYLQFCARQLVRISDRVQAVYNPKVHNPLQLIADAFSDLAVNCNEDLENEVLKRFSAGARGYAKANPGVVERLTEIILRDHPSVQSEFLTQILQPLGHSIVSVGKSTTGFSRVSYARLFMYRAKGFVLRMLKDF